MSGENVNVSLQVELGFSTHRMISGTFDCVRIIYIPSIRINNLKETGQGLVRLGQWVLRRIIIMNDGV